MLEVKPVNLKRVKVDTLVVPVCEDRDIHADKTLTSLIDAVKVIAAFKGKKGDVATLFQPAETRINRVVFFGLGGADALTGESFRAFAGKAVTRCIDDGLPAMTVATPSAACLNINAETLFGTLMEGASLGNHIFDRYKQKKEKKPVKKIILMSTAAQKKVYAGLAESVSAICTATVMAREWVTTPSNDKRPAAFAEMIRKAATSAGLAVSVRE
jgi:leucyl aminopeptidase